MVNIYVITQTARKIREASDAVEFITQLEMVSNKNSICFCFFFVKKFDIMKIILKININMITIISDQIAKLPGQPRKCKAYCSGLPGLHGQRNNCEEDDEEIMITAF